MVKTQYTIDTAHVAREIEIAEGKVNRDERNLGVFLHRLGETTPLDTGWIPPGLRLFAQAGRHQQFVIECPPDINRVYWGERERDREVKTYLLAQPFRILIGDVLDGNFYGARMFYSPTPLVSPDQQLYMANVPNLNCEGYQGNAIGWLCLYQNESWQGWTIAQKVARIIERCSGAEAYNNANMRNTDGPRFYQKQGSPQFTWDPDAWERKSDLEGIGWTLNHDLWIPALVTDENNQDRYRANGKPLTLEMAVNGNYAAYYNDSLQPKPTQAIRRGETPNDLFEQTVQRAFTATSAKAVKPQKLAVPDLTATAPLDEEGSYCEDCDSTVADFEMYDGYICQSCFENNYIGTCVSCADPIHQTNEHYTLYGETYCSGCADFPICPGCAEGFLSPDGWEHPITGEIYCPNCKDAKQETLFTCAVCNWVKEDDQKVTVERIATEGEAHVICSDCWNNSKAVVCVTCEDLVAVENSYTTKNQAIACKECVVVCEECNYPVLKAETKDSRCSTCVNEKVY